MKNLKKNTQLFILAIGVVLVWRGVWGFADLYLLPNEPEISFILSIIAGIIILYLHGKNLKELF